MKKPYQIYRSPVLDRVLSDRVRPEEGSGRGRSAMVSTIADRYEAIVARHTPALTVDEWCLIFDVLNGSWMADDAALTANGLAHSIADATTLDGLGTKWQIDGIDLARRIEAMAFADKIAILDTAERFWALGCREGETYPEIVARLTEK